MHAALSDILEGEGEEPVVRPRASLHAIAAPAPAEPFVHSGSYGATRRLNWSAIALILAAHAALILALVKLDVIAVKPPKKGPLVVDLVQLPDEPPPQTPPPPQEAKVEPVVTTPVQIIAPPPVVKIQAAAPTPVLTAPEPPPPRAVVVAPPAPKAPVTGPVSAGDLSSTMLSAKPPKYPVESRRKREQGTVVLTVLLSAAGSVAEVSVSRSSGFERLDKAALEAVRRWRWSPTLRGGEPVMVKGVVEIPFVLKG